MISNKYYTFETRYNFSDMKGLGPSDFLEELVQKHYNYIPKSEKVRLYDVMITPTLALNVKTMRLPLSSKSGPHGRLGSADVILNWIENPNHQLEYMFVYYKRDGEWLTLVDTEVHPIESLEFTISPQGKGLVQPKRRNDRVALGPTLSREEYVNTFVTELRTYCKKQIKNNEKQLERLERFNTNLIGALGI